MPLNHLNSYCVLPCSLDFALFDDCHVYPGDTANSLNEFTSINIGRLHLHLHAYAQSDSVRQ